MLLYFDLIVSRFPRLNRLSIYNGFGTVRDFGGVYAYLLRLYISTEEHHLLDYLHLDRRSPRRLVFVEPFANGGLQDCVVQ